MHKGPTKRPLCFFCVFLYVFFFFCPLSSYLLLSEFCGFWQCVCGTRRGRLSPLWQLRHTWVQPSAHLPVHINPVLTPQCQIILSGWSVLHCCDLQPVIFFFFPPWLGSAQSVVSLPCADTLCDICWLFVLFFSLCTCIFVFSLIINTPVLCRFSGPLFFGKQLRHRYMEARIWVREAR